jgi:hypothetical protein
MQTDGQTITKLIVALRTVANAPTKKNPSKPHKPNILLLYLFYNFKYYVYLEFCSINFLDKKFPFA